MIKKFPRPSAIKTDLSALAFALVKIKAKGSKQNNVDTQDIIDELLRQFVEIFRTPDTIGEVGKNNFIVLLPMTPPGACEYGPSKGNADSAFESAYC